jgi:hypothetical protein
LTRAVHAPCEAIGGAILIAVDQRRRARHQPERIEVQGGDLRVRATVRSMLLHT